MIEPGLTTTTLEYWPINAKNIMREKNVNIDELKLMFEFILFPWDDKYNTDRTYFSLRVQQRPLFIVKPSSIAEIESILDYVKLKNLTIRVCIGRHSSALVYSEVLVDMVLFLNKSLNGDVLTAGASNTQGALNEFLFNENSLEHYSHFGSFIHPRVDSDSFPGGSAASVSSGGISLSGGIGTLCRTYSLTIDSVQSYQITLCPTSDQNAKTVIASEQDNSELFWALKGAGNNNYGIVSEIIYKIIIVPSIVQYTIEWPWDQAVRVLKLWKKTSIGRPYQFNEDLLLYHNPQTKKQGIELGGIYVNIYNQTEEQISAEIHRQVNILGGILTISPQIPYSDLYRKLVKNRIYYNYSIIQPLFTNKVCSKHIVKMMDQAVNLKGPASISFTLLGGKISETASNATAFYPRKKHFFLDIASLWNNLTDSEQMESWTNNAIKKLLDVDHTFAYVGFPITFTNIKYTNRIYYGKNYRKLRELKALYDPLNILTSCGTITD